MTTPDTKAIRELKSKRSKCADVGNLDLSNVPESHETIWLQWGDNGGDDDTWCANNVNDEDVPYIRADLVHSLCDALDDLRAEVKTLRRQAETLKEGWRISDEGRIEAESENEKLRAALKPFADEAAYWSCHNYTCEDKPVEGFSGYQPVMTCGDLFNARVVLATCKAELGED